MSAGSGSFHDAAFFPNNKGLPPLLAHSSHPGGASRVKNVPKPRGAKPGFVCINSKKP
jgi:hypothetical protein